MDLVNWFAEVGTIITSAFDYLINVISSIVAALQLIASSISFPLEIVGYVPPVIGSAIVVTLAIAVINFLIPG